MKLQFPSFSLELPRKNIVKTVYRNPSYIVQDISREIFILTPSDIERICVYASYYFGMTIAIQKFH